MADTQAEIKVALESLNKSVEGLKAHNLRQANTLSQILGVMNDQTAFMKGEAAEDEFKEDVAKAPSDAVEANQEAVKASKEESKKTKGFLSKIGGLFSGIGIGAAATIGAIGIAAAGIALVVMSITKLIEVMSNLDAGMIKDKVVTLLSIADAVEKDGKSFIGEGAKFFLAMVGIGLGLLVFGLGAGVAGLTIRLVQAGFAEKVLHIVTKLMEIPAALGGNVAALAGGGTFLAVMMGIGLGLLVFGIGQAVASLTIRLAQQGFAEKVLQIVTKLMEIPAALGGNVAALAGGGTFLAVMIGIGLGLMVFGAGLAVSSLVLRLVQEDFAGKVLQIVTKLMEIPTALGGPAQALKDAGTFGLVMLAIGAGLLVFGAGLGLATLVTSLVGDNFAQNVVDIVTTLLSINNLFSGLGNAFVEGGTFIVAMLGIAIGLYIFAAGAIAGSISSLVAGNFAQNVVDTVTTLLSINNLFSNIGDAFTESGTFIVTMLGIAAGLFLFSASSAVGGVVTALVGSNFAQNVVNTVTTLLSIKDQLGGASEAFGDTGTFLVIMAGIAAGLLVFSIGEAAAGITSFIGGLGTGGRGIAESIADKVNILMQVARDTDPTAVTRLKTVLGGMREAIREFTGGLGGGIIDGLTNVARGIGGSNDPMDKILEFARSADELDRGTTALERLGDALTTVGNSGRNNNLQQFANNLNSVSQTVRDSLDKMLWGGGMGAERTRALEALAAVNLGSEGFAAMRDANAAATPPSVTNNITNALSNTGGTTNIFNDAGSIDRSLLEQIAS